MATLRPHREPQLVWQGLTCARCEAGWAAAEEKVGWRGQSHPPLLCAMHWLKVCRLQTRACNGQTSPAMPGTSARTGGTERGDGPCQGCSTGTFWAALETWEGAERARSPM